MERRTATFLHTLIIYGVVIQYGYTLQDQSVPKISKLNEDPALSENRDNFVDCRPDFGNVYPLNDGVTDQCFMKINKGDVVDFMHELRKHDFNINLLKIHLTFSQAVNWTRCTICHLDWIWTYEGKTGGYPYLYLMKEFSMYSLSILNHFTLSMNFRITVKGRCPVIIGDRNTTERIALAFLQTINRTLVPEGKAEMAYGYICYRSTTFSEQEMSFFIRYIINPTQTVGYRCCSNSFDRQTRMDNITCRSQPIMIDGGLWWNFPYIMGWLIFCYVPILILKMICNGRTHFSCEGGRSHRDWLRFNPVSFSVKLGNIWHKTFTAGRIRSSIFKVFFVILTPVLVFVEIVAQYICERDFVVSSTSAEVPLNWINMASGYKLSKNSFLPCFGGPFVALALYISSCSILLCIPGDLSIFIENGLEETEDLFASVVTVDLNTKGKFGAVFDIQRQTGYEKFFSILKANIYMLINPSFWILGVKLQVRRLVRYINMTCGGRPFCKLVLVLVFTPIYLMFCLCEWLLSVLLYGFPIVGFFVVLTRACYKSVNRTIVRRGRISFVVSFVAKIFMSAWIAFDIYIFSLLFIASFVFLSRMLTYTFTGLIAYPDITYGYIVFTITVVIYVTESIQHVNVVYTGLFEKLKQNCIHFQNKRLFPAVPLINTEGSYTVISASLFHYVLQNKRPVRIEILFSVMKVMIILIVLYMSISTLLAFKEISKMSALTQAITALFICLVPKLWKSLMSKNNKSAEDKELHEQKKIIEQYCKSYIYKRANTRIQNTYSENRHARVNDGLPDSDSDVEELDNNERYTDETDSVEELLLDIEGEGD